MIWVLLGVILAIAVFVIVVYNSLVSKRQMAENGWSDIAVQLKRRADLIPRLVETVKGYAKQERDVFKDVIEARNTALQAGDDVGSRANAEGQVARNTGRLFALAEDYPTLKSNENFLELQEELSDTEDKIEFARRFYNGAVRELNTAVETFPNNLIAGPFGFRKATYFEITEAEAQAPDVSFS